MGKHEDLAIDLLEAAFGDRFVRDDTRIFSLCRRACSPLDIHRSGRWSLR